MLRVTSETAPYFKALEKIDKGINIAAARAINTVAGFAHVEAIKNLRKYFKIRNKYTENSMRFYPANEKTAKAASYNKTYTVKQNLDRISAVSGSVSPYLPLLEYGGIQRPKPGSKFVLMPTTKGRGGNILAPIPKRLRLGPRGSVEEFGSGPGAKSKAGQYKFFALPSGIYYRVGRPHKGKRAAPGNARPFRPIIMIRTLGHESQSVKAHHWHEEAMKRVGTWENIDKAFIQNAKRVIADAENNK